MIVSEFIVNFILPSQPSTFQTSDSDRDDAKELPPARRRATDPKGPIATVHDRSGTHYMDSPSESTQREVGYLAQHRLLDRLPVLRRDILVPDYCALLTETDEQYMQNTISSPEEGGAGADNGGGCCDTSNDDVVINMWLGPCTTVSPLHHDPYHNLLAQIHGTPPSLYYPTELYYKHVLNISICTISIHRI